VGGGAAGINRQVSNRAGVAYEESLSRTWDSAGILHQNGKFFYVSLANVKFTAHRLVYYLRTGIDPGNADVLHLPDNPERDNRKELILKQRKPARIPKYRRNRNPKELQTTLVN